MKNILLVGSSSSAAQELFKDYKCDYHFIRLSRTREESDVMDFNVLDTDTYYKNEMKYDGLVYFPGSINLKPFKNLKIEDFYKDFEINIVGLIKILKFYQPHFTEGSSIIFISSLASKIGMPFHSSVSLVKSAIVTVIHNGIVVHNNLEVIGPTGHRNVYPYKAHASKGPLRLQDHGDLVRFRNIWARPIGTYDEG